MEQLDGSRPGRLGGISGFAGPSHDALHATRAQEPPSVNAQPLVRLLEQRDVRAAEALRQSHDELRRLSELLLSIQEDERRRIALDLHDGLGQSLSLIKLSVERAARLLHTGATTAASEALQQVLPQVNEALLDVRRVATELRPQILDDLGILPTLSWFFREFEAARGEINVETTVTVNEGDVPVRLHIALYRILQEAIHNVVSHSGADRVRVRLERIDDALQLIVEDNGRGFDANGVPRDQASGLGLLSMRERASLSGGCYELRSFPGAGTRITVRWPCELRLG